MASIRTSIVNTLGRGGGGEASPASASPSPTGTPPPPPRAATLSQMIAMIDRIARETSEGQQEVLINDLYECDGTAVEKILLQVVHVAVTMNTRNQLAMKRYLLHLATTSMLLGFRLWWMAEAVTPSFVALGLGDRVADLRDIIESATVNRKILMKGGKGLERPSRGLSAAESASPEAILLEVKRKQSRLTLFTHQRAFIAALTNISALLVKVSDRSKRKAELRRLLEDVNDRFVSKGRVYFPLTSAKDPVRWIVNICLQECTVFSSRERAPYLILFETITDYGTTSVDPSLSPVLDPQQEALRPTLPATPPQADGAAGGVEGFGGFGSGAPAASASASSAAGPSPTQVFNNPEADAIIHKVFGESNESKQARLRAASPYGKHPTWSTHGVIVKAGDDLKQEELALQLIDLFNQIWTDARLTLCVKPYAAISTTPDGGVIELVTDASSIDGVKKAAGVTSLKQFFTTAFGGENSAAYSAAQKNFVETMAGYSIVCYLLQIKDRHNGNLMLTREGHLVHIDFGFMLSTSPGGMGFESAPFKLSNELAEIMGGAGSAPFQYFKVLAMQGLLAVRERAREVIALLEIMIPYNTLPCYGPDPRAVVKQVESRFKLDLPTDVEYALYVRELVSISLDNWRTRRYDHFQTFQNGII